MEIFLKKQPLTVLQYNTLHILEVLLSIVIGILLQKLLYIIIMIYVYLAFKCLLCIFSRKMQKVYLTNDETKKQRATLPRSHD